MRKGEATRQRIVVRTADLLNTQGYRSTPVSEIMRVSGLQKGGIYRHFESRDALTLEAFEFAVARVRNRFLQAIEGKETAKDKLFALLEVARPGRNVSLAAGGHMDQRIYLLERLSQASALLDKASSLLDDAGQLELAKQAAALSYAADLAAKKLKH